MESLKRAIERESDLGNKEMIVMEEIGRQMDKKDLDAVYNTITTLSTTWNDITTARITKIIKMTLNSLKSDNFEEILIFVNRLISWSVENNKKMLSLDLECRKINALLKMKKIDDCLVSIKRVLVDLKKFDDKENQIMLFVCECQAYYEISDLSRARSSLAAARALAVASYCPASLQAQIDLLNGMLFCEEHIYSTAYSYFIESVDGFVLSKEFEYAVRAVRYLILSKIISKRYDDVNGILRSKSIVPFLKDETINLFLSVRDCCKNRNLCDYQNILNKNASLLRGDRFVFNQLQYLYNLLLEENIIKILEPYSNIKIEQISTKLGFRSDVVEEKIRKMILDGRITGTIDHVNQCVLLFTGSKVKELGRKEHVEVLKAFLSSF